MTTDVALIGVWVKRAGSGERQIYMCSWQYAIWTAIEELVDGECLELSMRCVCVCGCRKEPKG